MKTVEQYLEMPYHVSVARGESANGASAWAASVDELPDCTATGSTPEEAVKRLRRAMSRWISEALKADRAIPEPRQERTASGRLLVRMPRTLHAELSATAEREGVSLNQFITGALSTAVGWRDVEGNTAAPPVDGPEEPVSGRAQRWRSRPSLLTAALIANFVVMAAAAALAIAALMAAWD